MTRQEFLNAFTEMMELPSGSLEGRELLGASGAWDSMQMLSFIVMVRQKFEFAVDGASVARAKTVDDLIALLGDRVRE